jgi:hypothetical protein
MEATANPEILQEFGKRVQRCYGCFIAYHLKDMYLGEDVTFFCEHCKDDSMFHFDDFSRCWTSRSSRKLPTKIITISL